MPIGPSWPVSVPNQGEKVSWEGDQKESNAIIDNPLNETHRGSIVPPKLRPANGGPLTDLYVWGS